MQGGATLSKAQFSLEERRHDAVVACTSRRSLVASFSRSLGAGSVCWVLTVLFAVLCVPGRLSTVAAAEPVSVAVPLRSSAQGLEALGTVIGATYHEDRGVLVLWGDGRHRESSPTVQQVALALKWAFADKPDGYFVSIDPLEGDPYAPWMTVDISASASDTDFGWIMFEADRLLKSLSLGEDNVSGFGVSSAVPGFRSMRDLALSRGGSSQRAVWSRFWLYPRSAVMEVSSRGMLIRDASVGVRTEKMVLQGGKLVRMEGVSDPDADRFAAFFTSHYAAFADEFPVFRRLENSLRLLMVSEWIRRERIPLNLDWVYAAAESPYRLPRATPALHVAATTRTQAGNRITTRTIRLFGGADLDVEPTCVPEGERLRGFQREAESHVPSEPGGTGRYQAGADEVTGVAFSAGGSSPVPVTELAHVDLANGAALRLASRPSGVAGGRCQLPGNAEVALPRLCSFFPKARAGTVETFGVRGREDTLVQVRHYQMYAPDGRLVGRFEHHEIDQQRGEVVLRASGQGGDWRLYPKPDGIVYVAGPDGIVWIFDAASGAVIGQQIDRELLRYTYTSAGELSEIRCGDRWIRTIPGCNGTAILGYETSDGDRVELAGDPGGGARRTVVAYNEIGQRAEVFLDLGSGDLSPTDALPGQSFLARYGLAVSSAVSKSEGDIVFGEVVGDEGTALLTLGTSVRQLPTSARGLQRAMARLCGNPARCSKQVLEWLTPLVKDAGMEATIVVEDEDATTRQGIGLGLHHAGARQVFVTADGDLAKQHLAEIASRRRRTRPVEVRVLGDTLRERPVIREKFDALASQGGESDLVVVMGHRTENVAKQIEELAPSLSGKFAVFMICGDPSRATPTDADLHESLLREHGVIGLVGYDHMIDADDAAAVVNRMQELGRSGDAERNPFEVYRDALSECAAAEREQEGEPGDAGDEAPEAAPDGEPEANPPSYQMERMQRQPAQVHVMPPREEDCALAA